MATQPRPTTWTWGETGPEGSPLATLERRTLNGRLVYVLALLPRVDRGINAGRLPAVLWNHDGLLTLPAKTHTEALERAQACVDALQTYLDTLDTAERKLGAALAAARDGQTDLLEELQL
jgi:hypothetical protein